MTEIITMLLCIIANLLLLFGKHFGILLSDFSHDFLHLVIMLCLGVCIAFNGIMSKKAKSILMTILVITFIIAFINLLQ